MRKEIRLAHVFSSLLTGTKSQLMRQRSDVNKKKNCPICRLLSFLMIRCNESKFHLFIRSRPVHTWQILTHIHKSTEEPGVSSVSAEPFNQHSGAYCPLEVLTDVASQGPWKCRPSLKLTKQINSSIWRHQNLDEAKCSWYNWGYYCGLKDTFSNAEFKYLPPILLH